MSLGAWAAQRQGEKPAERLLEQMPRSETDHGAKVPLPFADRKAIKDKHSNKEINKAIAKAPVKKVQIKDLYAIQHSVKPERVREYIRNPETIPGKRHPEAHTPTDHPVVIRQGGKSYLWDGHHRVTARILRGKTDTNARVVDLG